MKETTTMWRRTYAVLGMLMLGAGALMPMPLAQAAATIIVNNLDGAGEGFNEPTFVPPVGGNPATTLGEQRLWAFQYAADILGGLINSSVPIIIDARMDPLFGNATSAVLGQAGPTNFVRDFAGATRPSTWYPVALANSLAGSDLDPPHSDAVATFNSDIDGEVLGSIVWYYGLDGHPPDNDLDFVTVVLHELTHTMGFTTIVDLMTGAKPLGLDDVYMVNLCQRDALTGVCTPYPSMTNGERRAANISMPELRWEGPHVVAANGGQDVEMYAPDPLALGSSVVHWSTALFPNELMEPAYSGPNHNLGLALPAFQDMDWDTGAQACDLNQDGRLDRADVILFISGCQSGVPPWTCDVNGDGRLNRDDVRQFVASCRSGATLDEAEQLTDQRVFEVWE
jgi:hypothetical protein